tara:strand:+ start:851 stop:1366 length:516 start_codon:yes stop_codon:yes gene_type:complete
MAKENTTKEVKYWQWIKGEDSGNVVTIKNIDDKWIHFNEGGRLAKDLKSEFIQELDADIAGEFVNKTIDNDPLHKGGSIQPPAPPSPTEHVSPIRLLLDKQKKLDKIPLGLSFKVNAPKLDIMLILENSFDLSELNQELEKFIEDQIDTEEVIRTLKDSIKILIEERYKQA